MNVLFIGGQRTANTVQPLQKNLQNSGVNIITEMYIEDIQNVYNRGDSFDKLVVIQPAWTHNKQLNLDQMTTDMYGNSCTVSQSLITLIGDLAQRKQVNQQFIFIPAVGETDAAELIQSEIIQLHGSAAVIVQPAKLTIQFMQGLILKDIDAYDSELIYKPQPVETGDDDVSWQPQDGDGSGFGKDPGWGNDDNQKSDDNSQGDNGFNPDNWGGQPDNWTGGDQTDWTTGDQTGDNSWINNSEDNQDGQGDNGFNPDNWGGQPESDDQNQSGQNDFGGMDWGQNDQNNLGFTPDPGFNPDGGIDTSGLSIDKPEKEQPVQDESNWMNQPGTDNTNNQTESQVDPYADIDKSENQTPDPYKTDMDINGGYDYGYGSNQNIDNTGDPQFGTRDNSIGNEAGGINIQKEQDQYGLTGGQDQFPGDPYDDGGSSIQPPEQQQFDGQDIYPVGNTNIENTGNPYGDGSETYPQGNMYGPDNGQDNGYNPGYPGNDYQDNGYTGQEQQNADDIYGREQQMQQMPVQQAQPVQQPVQQNQPMPPKKKKSLFGFGKKQHQQAPVQPPVQQMPMQPVSMNNSPYDDDPGVNNGPYGNDPVDMRPVGMDGQRQLSNVNLNDVQKLFAAFANRGNSILVTGAPGAGTQTIAYQLANVLRLMNYSVLLVDFDTVGRSQSYITEANYNATDPDENKLAQAVNSSSGISKHLIVPSQNLHLLDLGLALDSKPLEEMIQKNRVMKFANSAKNGHNFVIYDAPFEAATGHLDDLTTMQDNIVIVSDASTWGSMKTLLYMMNIADDTVLETMFNKSQILFNRYRGYPKILNQKIRNPQDILKAMDKQVEKLVGTDIGYQFQQMHCCGSLGYIDKFEEGWLGKDKQQYTATRDGQAVFVEILKNIVLKGSGR